MASLLGRHWGVAPTYQETAPEQRLRAEEDWEAGRREVMMTRWMEQPGQRLSTDPSGLLLKRSPELWDLLVYCCGSWDCQKIGCRGKLSSLCYGQQGKNQLWLQMEPSFASDRLCCPGEVISPLWDSVATPPPRTIHASLSRNQNWVRYSV